MDGGGPAMTTPFTVDDEVDLSMFGKNLFAQMQAGVHGIIIGGSLGEASTITTEEKEKLCKTALEICEEKIPVILNIVKGSLKQALQQIKFAEDWGVDDLMVLPPMRYKPDERETIQWFQTIATTTALPIMLYNNSVDYECEVTIEMFEKLADCKNIQAVKESTRDVSNVTRMKNRFGNRFKILCGVDMLAIEELLMGADGWVAGLVDVFPEETMAVYNLIKENKTEEARKIYRWFMPLLELDIHPKLVQYIKLAQSLTALGTEYVRSPRLMLAGEERERILEIIEEAIAKKPAIHLSNISISEQ
ncbi:MAG: dihydrodipicolinate synthase family protein [Chitinophagaceae bacterium]